MSEKTSCVILGSGGHARMLMDCLRFSPDVEIAGILDPTPSLHGKKIHDVPVLGNDDLLGEMARYGVSHFVVGVGGVGDNRPRKKIFEAAVGYGLIPLEVKHPTAVISDTVVQGTGCQFLPGCIVNTDAVLGVSVIVNSGAIVEHDCFVADYVHIATGARLAGAVRVGYGAHIGAGATIRQNIEIGEFALVGAGSVVVANVPPNTIVMGVPAKIHPGKVVQ
jgi:sugar O-acyltransferase (sialic acid O-acetyltransferase NeuD family)